MKSNKTKVSFCAWIGGNKASVEDLKNLRDKWKSEEQKVVTTNGCFDLLHPGHIQFLKAARNEGDMLVVGLNSDRSVRTLKGIGKPLFNEEQRAEMLSALNSVSAVLVFDDLLPIEFLKIIRPDIHCKAADYDADALPESDVVKKHGGKILILPLIEGFSSTNLTERILNAHESTDRKSGDRVQIRSGAMEQADPKTGEQVNSNTDDVILTYLLSSSNVYRQTAYRQKQVISEGALLFTETLKSGNKILLCGNGGSAADSQHIAAELVGRFKKERKALPAIALTTDTSILTAIGNDYGFEQIFSRQIAAMGNSGDLLVAISTSGHSQNVLKAIEEAQKMGIMVIGLTGEAESPVSSNADLVIRVPSTDTALIQQVHIGVMHLFCDIAEKKLFE